MGRILWDLLMSLLGALIFACGIIVLCVFFLGACVEKAVQVSPVESGAIALHVDPGAVQLSVDEGAVVVNVEKVAVVEAPPAAASQPTVAIENHMPAIPPGAVDARQTITLNGKTPWVIGGAAVAVALVMVFSKTIGKILAALHRILW